MENSIEDIRMTPAENGAKIEYTECHKSENSGAYANKTYKYKTEVFGTKELNKAFARFKELWMMSYNKTEGEDD